MKTYFSAFEIYVDLRLGKEENAVFLEKSKLFDLSKNERYFHIKVLSWISLSLFLLLVK